VSLTVHRRQYLEIKCQLDATDWFFIAKRTVRSTCFGHHYARHQELKIYTDGCCSIPQTGHITHSSTPGQRPVNQSAKYHRQQPSV